MRTIKSKILFVVITALIVITSLVTYIAVTITHEILHQDADRILNNVSQKEVALINDMLNDFVKSADIMEHYASHELKDTASLKDPKYLEEYTLQLRHLFDEIAKNTSGTSSYYLCFSPALTERTAGFYSTINAEGTIHELTESEFSGLSIITDDELIAFSNSTGAAGGEWLQPHPSRFTGDTVISYIMPVYKDSTFVAILGFNMNFNYMLDRVNSISVYDYGCALLFGADNEICYNQSEKSEFTGDFAVASTKLVNGMHLNLHATYKDIQSGIRPMLTYIVLAFSSVLVLAIIYTIGVTHRIVTPLKKLTMAAKKISSGMQQDVDIIIDSKDEIGILSNVLSNTYEKIREYSSYINALAYKDSLTGLKNCTAYTEAVAKYNDEINSGNAVFGLIVADMNNLKETNDTFGHDVGNKLIIHTANILTDTFKNSPVYRIGGDEFVILLKGQDLENHLALIEKMDVAFATENVAVGDKKVSLSIARGVSIFNPSIDHTYSNVFEKADQAMYMNKKAVKTLMA